MLSIKSVIQVAIGAAIGVLAGGSFVWAHGGDTSLVHACVYSGPNYPDVNVQIVGASQNCAGGSSPVDWAMAGPPGPAGAPGATGPIGPRGPAPTTPELRSSVVQIGIPRTTIRIVTASAGPDFNRTKSVTALCPATHPLVVSGSYAIEVPSGILGRFGIAVVTSNGRVVRGGRDGWQTVVLRQSATRWKLNVRAECAHSS